VPAMTGFPSITCGSEMIRLFSIMMPFHPPYLIVVSWGIVSNIPLCPSSCQIHPKEWCERTGQQMGGTDLRFPTPHPARLHRSHKLPRPLLHEHLLQMESPIVTATLPKSFSTASIRELLRAASAHLAPQ
jgi:hypothetical protein